VSLLDRANAQVIVRPQVLGTDSDGNPVWTPSPIGVPLDVMLWPVGATEAAAVGRGTGEVYRLRPARGQRVPLGPWATVVWDGREWDVHGEAARLERGQATRRTVATIHARTKRPGDGGE